MSSLRKVMSMKLPSKTEQRKLPYRLTKRQMKKMYKMLNEELFNNRLPAAKLVVKKQMKNALGTCEGHFLLPADGKKSSCEIALVERWYCKQWSVIVLAHEMVHQYQWDIYSKNRKNRVMSHGPSFIKFRKKFERKGIPLLRYMTTSRWFKTQNFFRL